MKELKQAISAFSADVGQLQSLPAKIEQLARICAAPSHIGPIEFSSAVEGLREQAAVAAAEAEELANSFAKATPLQEILDRVATVYQHQHAAIAALESHLRAYGYTAQCRAPAEPLADSLATQQQLAHAAETLPADMQKGCNSGMAAAADSAADAVDQTCAPGEPPAKTEPPANACSTDGADILPAAQQQARPLADVTNLPPVLDARHVAKSKASPAAASTPSSTPSSVSPSLRKLQQKYAVRPIAADTPPENLLAMPPRLVAGMPAASHAAAGQQNKQQALSGIGRWQQQQPGVQRSAQTQAAEHPMQQSQQRPRPTVRFAGVRSMSRSPAEGAAAQQGFAQPDLGCRASVYGQASISLGGSTAAQAVLQDDASRRASMYAAVDLAAGGAAVGPPGGWATSAELRSAQVRKAEAAEDPELWPVTPAPPPASGSTAAEAEAASIAAAAVTELVSASGSKAGPLMPRLQPLPPQQGPQQPPAEEESTMELYSQLIRRRRSPEPQARTPEATTGQLGFCYTPLTRDAHTAISPDTVSLLCRAFEPTSVSKGKRPNGSAAAPVGTAQAAKGVTMEADLCGEFSGRLPAASIAFARAGAAVAQRHPTPATAKALPPSVAAQPAAATQTAVAQPAESAEASLKRSCPAPRKTQVAMTTKHTSPTVPEPSPRAAAVMANFAAQKAQQSAALPAPASSGSSSSSPRSAMLITTEAYGGLPAYIRSQIGLEALTSAMTAAASAAGGFTADTLQSAAGSAKAARAAVNCLMKLGRARCEVKGGQMVYHLCN